MTEKSTASDLSQTKLLEAGKSTRRLLNRLGSPRLSPQEMASTMTLIAKETSILKSWVHAISQIQTFGARQFARTSSTAASDVGLDSFGLSQVNDDNERDPWQIPRVRQKFIDDCYIQFHLKMSSLDQLSQLGSMAFDDGRDTECWGIISDKVWTSWATRGSNALIHGGVKRGKSNLALWLCERFLQTGRYEVVSNIVVEHPPSGYTYTPKLSTMLREICRIRMAGKEALIIFDEANLFWQKIETIQPRNISLSKLILTFGKTHSNLLYITHYSELTPTIVSRTAVAVFEKLSIKECRVAITEGKYKLKSRVLRDVPPTGLRYSPDQLAWFDLDLDVNELFTYMASLPALAEGAEGGEQWSALLSYVQAHAGETGVETLDPKQVVLWLRRRGLSEKKIAEATGKAASTVHLWVSAKE